MESTKLLTFIKNLDGIEGYILSNEGLPFEIYGSFEEGEEEELSANLSALLREFKKQGIEEGILKGKKTYLFVKLGELDLAIFGNDEIIKELASLISEPFRCPNCHKDLTFEVYECPKCGKKLPITIPYCPFCKKELTYKKCPNCGKKVSVSGRKKPPIWERLWGW